MKCYNIVIDATSLIIYCPFLFSHVSINYTPFIKTDFYSYFNFSCYQYIKILNASML